MIVKNRDRIVPEAGGSGLDEDIRTTMDAVTKHMDELRIHDALASAMDLARAANGYVDRREPWAQAKDPERAGELDETLATLTRALTVLTALFLPVTPEKMTELAKMLGLDGVPPLEEAAAMNLAGRRVRKGIPLFPKPDQNA